MEPTEEEAAKCWRMLKLITTAGIEFTPRGECTGRNERLLQQMEAIEAPYKTNGEEK